MKYVIPRNKLIPDPSFQDIINSGAGMKDEAGHAKGDRDVIWRGSDPNIPNSAIPVGTIYPFNMGLIYVPDKAQSYFEMATETFRAGLAFTAGELASGLAEAALGELPRLIDKILGDAVEQAIYPEQEAESLRVEELVKRGALYLPGVQIVEIEHHVIPGGFLRRDKHRIGLTYERLDGQLTTYIIPLSAAEVFDAYAGAVLSMRGYGELTHLAATVHAEAVDVESLLASYIVKYQSRYGAAWREHADELIAEFEKEVNGELERKGVTDQRIAATIMERIAQLIPYYQQVPKLRDIVQILESGEMPRVS